MSECSTSELRPAPILNEAVPYIHAVTSHDDVSIVRNQQHHWFTHVSSPID